MKKIPFNKPFLIGKEVEYIAEAVKSGKISGNGMFTQKCHEFFEQRYGFKKVLLTASCTDALEMTAILADIQPGDEVILPSYTFVSTANAFVLRDAKLVFADSEARTPNIDATALEALITPRSKAIVVVHYAGVACDMDVVMELSRQHHLIVIEDAAQAIDAYYKGKPLGSIGHLAAFSFHETKNIISGEGGMLVIKDERFQDRAEIIWEKGTNRAAFFRGKINKYRWVDVGSSFLPSEVTAAFLYAQLEKLQQIQEKRVALWNQYYDGLQALAVQGRIHLPVVPDYATNNGHLFYILCSNLTERQSLIGWLKEHQIHAVFHYLSLHESPFYHDKHDGRELPNTDRYMDCLLRLPMYYELENEEQAFIIATIKKFFEK